MRKSPVKLLNLGSKCYLNSCIQAISSCPIFISEINELHNKSDKLVKLKLFACLMKTMNDRSTDCIDVSNDDIFKDWIKTGQQDSFELLSFVINQVYDEYRRYKEIKDNIKRDSMDKWLQVQLPLRITMEYEIICTCKRKEVSPLQSDIALHLAFTKSKSNTFKSYVQVTAPCDIQGMLNDYFSQSDVNGFLCENCCNGNGRKKVTLKKPFPSTICIHLQRLSWNGRKMSKIYDRVNFCNRLTLKREYLENGNGTKDGSDLHFYLKSVIEHQGRESSGHYICYKKCNNTWFFTSDTISYSVDSCRVFESNPYILFYERCETEDSYPVQIITQPSLNTFIHSLSSCQVFVAWLKGIEEAKHNRTIGRLCYLIDFINGNIARNMDEEKRIVFEWCKKSELYEMMTNIFSGIVTDSVDENESVMGKEVFNLNTPLRNLIVSVNRCDCGTETLSPASFQWFIHVTTKAKQTSLQLLIEESFEAQYVNGKVCDNKTCTQGKGRQTLKLQLPSPKVLLVHVNHSNSSHKVLVANELYIKNGFYLDGERNDNLCDHNFLIYELKSIICYDKPLCYRKIGTKWYIVGRKIAIDVSNDIHLNCNPSVVFFEMRAGTDSDASVERNAKNDVIMRESGGRPKSYKSAVESNAKDDVIMRESGGRPTSYKSAVNRNIVNDVITKESVASSSTSESSVETNAKNDVIIRKSGRRPSTNISPDNSLINVIHSLSSCRSFLAWLNLMQGEGKLLHSCPLLHFLKEPGDITAAVQEFENDTVDIWKGFVFNKIDDLILKVFNDLHDYNRTTDLLMLPILIFNLGVSRNMSIDSNISCEVKFTFREQRFRVSLTIQQFIDQYLKIYSNPVSKKTMILQNMDFKEKIIFQGNLPAIIIFAFPLSCSYFTEISVSTEIKIRNELCSKNDVAEVFGDCHDRGCCYVYHLKSIIDPDNGCYTRYNDTWTKINCSTISVVEESLLCDIKPRFLFYEEGLSSERGDGDHDDLRAECVPDRDLS